MLLTKLQLKAHQLTSKDVSRPSLHNLLVDIGGKVTVSDGVSLVQITPPVALPPAEEFPAPNGEKYPRIEQPFMVTADSAKAALKSFPNKSSLPILQNAVVTAADENSSELTTTDLTQRSSFKSLAPASDFPNCRVVIDRHARGDFHTASEKAKSDGRTHTRIVVDALKLSGLLKYIAGEDKFKPAVEILVPKDPTKAVILRRITGDGHQIDALLMPMRD